MDRCLPWSAPRPVALVLPAPRTGVRVPILPDGEGGGENAAGASCLTTKRWPARSPANPKNRTQAGAIVSPRQYGWGRRVWMQTGHAVGNGEIYPSAGVQNPTIFCMFDSSFSIYLHSFGLFRHLFGAKIVAFERPLVIENPLSPTLSDHPQHNRVRTADHPKKIKAPNNRCAPPYTILSIRPRTATRRAMRLCQRAGDRLTAGGRQAVRRAVRREVRRGQAAGGRQAAGDRRAEGGRRAAGGRVRAVRRGRYDADARCGMRVQAGECRRATGRQQATGRRQAGGRQQAGSRRAEGRRKSSREARRRQAARWRKKKRGRPFGQPLSVCSGNRQFNPSFLAIGFGMARLLTITVVVL